MPDQLIDGYQALLDHLAPHRGDCGGGNLKYAWQVTYFLLQKLKFRRRLLAAYQKKDRAEMESLRENALPESVRIYDEFVSASRAQWLSNGKVFGLENMQHRLGGQRERLLETGRRIGEHLAGETTLPELEEPGFGKPERMRIYCDIVSGSVII